MLLSLLLCSLSSCFQTPGDAPSDDPDSTASSELQGETTSPPDGSIVITASEWDAELKTAWESFLAGGWGEIEHMTKKFYDSYALSFTPSISEVDSTEIEECLTALKNGAAFFDKPVTVETIVNGEPTNPFISPLGMNLWIFVYDGYSLSVGFSRAPAIQTGDADAYFVSLTVTQQPNPLYPNEGPMMEYNTLFQVTAAQYHDLFPSNP